MATGQFLSFEQGWPIIQDGIDKLINKLEGISNHDFPSSVDYMRYYTVVTEICHSDKTFTVSKQVYAKYLETFDGYITSKVLPSLREKKDEGLVKEMVKRWSNHKIMVHWLSRFFYFLNRNILPRILRLPSTEEAGFMAFYNLVYSEMKVELGLILISMINREREGENIDQTVLKNAVNIYVEMGRGSLEYYQENFEKPMLEDAAQYYSNKASSWIMVHSYAEYIFKANDCLEQEKDRAAIYLTSNGQQKLLEIVDQELLGAHSATLQVLKRIGGDNLLNTIIKR